VRRRSQGILQVTPLFEAGRAPLHPQYMANDAERGCVLLVQVGAVMVTEPPGPLAAGLERLALIPLEPPRLLQSGICCLVLKPESRLTAAFTACLGEEAQSILDRVAPLLGGGWRPAA
jgi:hypothetical protein